MKQTLVLMAALMAVLPSQASLINMNKNQPAYVATHTGVAATEAIQYRNKSANDGKNVLEDSTGAYTEKCTGFRGRNCTKTYFTTLKYAMSFDTFSLDTRVLPETAKSLKQTQQTMSFISVGDNGNELGTEFRYSNAAFSRALISGQTSVRVRQLWALASCDGQSVTYSSNSDLDSAIAELRRFDFTRYMSCKLTRSSRRVEGYYRDVEKAAACSEQGVECYGANALVLRENGDIEVLNSQENPVSYYRPSQVADKGAEQAVEEATQDLITRFKAYSNLLVMLANSKQADKTTGLNEWIKKNKGAIVQDLQVIENNLNRISTLSKLNTASSINRAYGYVQTVEVGTRGGLILDEVIQTGK